MSGQYDEGKLLEVLKASPGLLMRLNRTGPCDFCGTPLDWYDSKWIEVVGTRARICCAYSHRGCGARDLGANPFRHGFWYYTDG